MWTFSHPSHPVVWLKGEEGLDYKVGGRRHVSAIGSESMLDASIPVCWARFPTKWVKGDPSFIFMSHWGGGIL